MSEPNPIEAVALEIERAEANAPPLAPDPPFRLEPEPATPTPHQKGLFNGE